MASGKSYYPDHNFGIHIWFPLFNSIQKQVAYAYKKTHIIKILIMRELLKIKLLNKEKISEKN